MGCASSKQPICRNCKSHVVSPVPRSYSLLVHHPPLRQGDTYHLVALTSSTLGSLKLDSTNPNQSHQINNNDGDDNNNKRNVENAKEEFSTRVIEAKTWSKMINEKIPNIIPKTPITTPPGEPETINTWELMEGLEDTSPLLPPPHHLRSFSFHVAPNSIPSPISLHNHPESKPIISELDPDVISSFRKTLEELPPANPFHLKPLEKPAKAGDGRETEYEYVAKEKDKVVLYFTSLRGVRKTYEDCCYVRVILKGVGVRVDERDVSMHSGFKEELRELMGDGFNVGGLLPRVFVGKKNIGGVEDIRILHEEGRLEKVLGGCELAVDDGDGGGGVCKGCGDVRFVPCETCSGSCKIFFKDDSDDEEECEENDFGFQRCPDCNENGLIRCPICCD